MGLEQEGVGDVYTQIAQEADSALTCRVYKQEEGMSRRELAETGSCAGRCRPISAC